LNKVILVLSDALRYDAAVAGMGYLGHLVEAKRASLYKVVGELPSMSRPMYETVHTGVPVSEHGVVSNYVVRRSTMPNIFQLAVEAGKSTAAAAYYWFSELYNRAPYDPIDDGDAGSALPPEVPEDLRRVPAGVVRSVREDPAEIVVKWHSRSIPRLTYTNRAVSRTANVRIGTS